jgi:hypothetical protein
MNHYLECHNKIKADEFRLLPCFEFGEEDGHCCLSKLLSPNFDIKEEREEETEIHQDLMNSAIDRYSEVTDLAKLTRFELKVAATFMNCCVGELDMTLQLPRDLENGENAAGAFNFFSCPCMDEDHPFTLPLKYE